MGMTYEQLRNDGYSTRKDTGIGLLSNMIKGYQDAVQNQQTLQSNDYAVAKQRADLQRSGFPVEERGGFAGLIEKLIKGDSNKVQYDQYQNPMTQVLQSAGASGLQPDSYNSATGAMTFKNNSMTPYQQQKVALDKDKFALDQKKQKIADEERAIANANKVQMITNNAKSMLDSINVAKNGIDYFGLTGDLWAIPGTEKVDWHANVDKIVGRKVVDLMNEMKSASRTGATGFGQLNKSELDLIKNASIALKKTTSPEKAKVYLDQMEQGMIKLLGDYGQNYAPSNQGATSGQDSQQNIPSWVPDNEVEFYKQAKSYNYDDEQIKSMLGS